MDQTQNGAGAQSPTSKLAVQLSRPQSALRISGSTTPWRDILTPCPGTRLGPFEQQRGGIRAGRDGDHQGRVRHFAPMVLERKSPVEDGTRGIVRKLEIVPFSSSVALIGTRCLP